MFLPLADGDVFSLWPEMLILSEFMEGMSFEETLESPNDPGGQVGAMKANIGSDFINIS